MTTTLSMSILLFLLQLPIFCWAFGYPTRLYSLVPLKAYHGQWDTNESERVQCLCHVRFPIPFLIVMIGETEADTCTQKTKAT